MLTLIEITTTATEMRETLEAMQRRFNKLNDDIAKAKSDNSRSPAFIAETIERLRNDALPFFGERLKLLKDKAATIRAEQTAWSNKPYMLSRQRYSAVPATDATIRAARGAELALMDSDLLNLTATEAKKEANLPLLFQCYLAGVATRTNGALRVDIALDDVVISEQAEALAAIATCSRYPAQAELVAGATCAAGLAPLRKMELAREAMPRPTKHNSAGRLPAE